MLSDEHIISLIGNSLFFNGEYYLATNPDVAAAGVDPLRHYVDYGAGEDRNPSRWFDAAWYKARYLSPSTQLNPLLYHIREGEQRGFATSSGLLRFSRRAEQGASKLTPIEQYLEIRDTIEKACLFDSDWYGQAYPDIPATSIDPLEHYIFHGAEEFRSPSGLFDARWYCQTYPDALIEQNPLLHYLKAGSVQGHATHPAVPPELLPGKRTGGYAGELTPLGQYVRARRLIASSFLFERDWYLDSYKNVAASGGDALQHFLLHGVGAGYNPNRLFDTRWYLAEHPDVRAAGENPLAHYIREGAKLGYDPHPFFSNSKYLREYGSKTPEGWLPLEDFLYRVTRREPGLFPRFSPYDVFRATQESRLRTEAPSLKEHVVSMSTATTFVVFVDGDDGEARLRTEGSLSSQIYTGYRVAQNWKEFLSAAREEDATITRGLWINAGDELGVDALYELASCINADPDEDLIYFDHDVGARAGRCWPMHKPGWSPDHLEASNYLGSAVCFRLSIAASALAEAASRYDFLLRLTEAPMRIRHIDRVLLHVPVHRHDADQEASDIVALAGRLERTGRMGTVRPISPGATSYDISIRIREQPLVSFVLPTAGKVIEYNGRVVDLIFECIRSITKISTYSKYEFIVVDNGDFDRERLNNIADDKIKYVSYLDTEVNIARKINIGAKNAAGSVLCILNDDVAPLTSDWIERMLGHLEKPHVGVVGPKLVYPDGTLQHVGMVACDGHLHHVRHRWPNDDPGYADSSRAVRNFVAVTGAVSMLRRDVFIEAGGYPEEFPIDYNDVSLCYSIRDLGYSVVFEPAATLLHYHAVSATRTPRPQDFDAFSRRWASLALDPYYNQYCFGRHPATFELSYTEREH